MNYRSNLKLGTANKIVTVIQNPIESKKPLSKATKTMHFIQLIDRSGSLYSEIGSLIENVKQTIDKMKDGDYITIVWFSGEGQFGVPIKGAKKDESIYKILDGLKSTVGCTCFSEALKEVSSIVDELSGLCEDVAVTLFTDGRPVVSWGEQKEYDKVYSIVEELSDKIVSLTTVGYGNYYNQDFLKKIADMTEYGTMFHSKDINEYFSIFEHNATIARNLVKEKLDVVVSSATDVILVGSKATKLTTGRFKLSSLDKTKNQLVLISSRDNKFKINGKEMHTSDIDKPIPKRTLIPIMYAYIKGLFEKGRVQEAVDVALGVLKDSVIAEKMLQSFTFDERARVSKLLNASVYSTKFRHVDSCTEDYVINPREFCVLDLFNILAGTSSYFYPDRKNYTRVTKEVKDNFNLFKSNDEPVVGYFNNIVYNEHFANVSFRFKINGTVSINPKSARKVNLDNEIDSYVYETHTIIKDGNLNVDKLNVVLTEQAYKEIKKKNSKLVKEFTTNSEGNYVGLLDLTAIPVINRMYAKKCANPEDIHELVRGMAELKAAQKVVNYFVNKFDVKSASSDSYKQYTKEQLEVLKEHGIAYDGAYRKLDAETVESGDYYESRKLDFALEGLKTLPKVEDVIDKVKKGAKLTPVQQLMANEFIKLNDTLSKGKFDLVTSKKASAKVIKELAARKDFIKEKLANISNELAAIRISSVLTNTMYISDKKDKKGNSVYEFGTDKLVIATERQKIYL